MSDKTIGAVANLLFHIDMGVSFSCAEAPGSMIGDSSFIANQPIAESKISTSNFSSHGAVVVHQNDNGHSFRDLVLENEAEVELKVSHKSNSPSSRLSENSAMGNTDVLSGGSRYYDLLNTVDTLDELKSTLLQSDICELQRFANNMVFSDGNPSAKIMLIGEAPGEMEDLQGRPFCGRSGNFLDKVLGSIDLSREKNVYITNMVFWRPPANRKPTETEIALCIPFVEKHIAIINPDIIIACGSTAANALLHNGFAISKLVGSVFTYNNRFTTRDFKLLPMFHPSFLLRNSDARAATWRHMIFLQKLILS